MPSGACPTRALERFTMLVAMAWDSWRTWVLRLARHQRGPAPKVALMALGSSWPAALARGAAEARCDDHEDDDEPSQDEAGSGAQAEGVEHGHEQEEEE